MQGPRMAGPASRQEHSVLGAGLLLGFSQLGWVVLQVDAREGPVGSGYQACPS